MIEVIGYGKGGADGGGATEADDTLRSKEYARIIDALCEGEIVGLVDGRKSVYLNDTPLDTIINGQAASNFKDVSVEIRTGLQNQSPIPGFPSAETPVWVNSKVTKPQPVSRTITNPNITSVRVTVSIPSLLYQDPETGDVTGTELHYRILLQSNNNGFVSQTVGGVATIPVPITSTSISTAANATGFSGSVSWTNLNTYEGNEIVYTIDYKLSTSSTWIKLITNRLHMYNMGDDNNRISSTAPLNFKKTGLVPGIYNIRIVKVSGSGDIGFDHVSAYAPADGVMLNDKTATTYQRSHLIDLSRTAPPWDIRVERVTDDSTATNLKNDLIWESYTEIVDAKLTYPNTAIVGIQLDASQFSSIPVRGYDVKLLKVKIPSNYDPISRQYTGIWDGTFKVEWTDNPAWCFYDLVTNARYGLGNYIDPALVDKAALYTIGQYCDELVPDGFGGVEPRFTCNLYIQTREEAYKILSDMASIFRGMMYWYNGAITAVQDSPQDTWAQFTNSNVVDGMFNYTGSSARTRHTVALVIWIDPNDGYRQKVEYVEDSVNLKKFGVNETQIVAFGCTSRGQAHRVGRWLLYTEQYETDIVTFKTGLKGISVTPGKIIQTIDANKAGVRFGGRVIGYDGSAITIDKQVVIETGKTYTIHVELNDGTIESRTITNAPGTYDTLTLLTQFTVPPDPFAVWVLSASDLSPELWRVLSVVEDEPNIYSIVAVEHNPSKYGYVEEGLELEIPNTSYVTTKVEPVSNVVIEVHQYTDASGQVGLKLNVSWSAPRFASYYAITYRKIGESLRRVESLTPSIEVYNVVPGRYEFTIIAFNALGTASVPITVYYTVLVENLPSGPRFMSDWTTLASVPYLSY